MKSGTLSLEPEFLSSLNSPDLWQSRRLSGSSGTQKPRFRPSPHPFQTAQRMDHPSSHTVAGPPCDATDPPAPASGNSCRLQQKLLYWCMESCLRKYHRSPG